MTKLTVATVNAELKRLGHSERLARGKDYLYFYDGETHLWKSSSVFLPSPMDMTLDEWVAHFLMMKNEYENSKS